MLRINLLPPYIYDRQKKRKWIVGSLALIPITLAVMLWWGAVAQDALNKANERKANAQAQQDQYNSVVQAIKKEQDAVAATKAKHDFLVSAIKYNASWPKVYTAMRDVTSPKVLLKSMYVSDDRKSINFTGFCQYEEDLVRWWMYLRQQSNMFTDVHFSLPEHPWPPKADTTSAGAMGGPGMGSSGMPGGSGGMPGMPGGSGGMPGMPGGSPGMGGSGGMGGSPGMGSFGGGGGSSDAVGEEEIEGRKGIKFSAFAVLKEPLAGGIPTPAWAGGGAASGAASPGGTAPMGSYGMGPMSGGMSSSGGRAGARSAE